MTDRQAHWRFSVARQSVKAMKYDPAAAATFFDDYAEREWSRFDDDRSVPPNHEFHTRFLERYVRPKDDVLDVGGGPGRFTVVLARIGARITVADISRVQLDLNRRTMVDAGLEAAVTGRFVADITDLHDIADAKFDIASATAAH